MGLCLLDLTLEIQLCLVDFSDYKLVDFVTGIFNQVRFNGFRGCPPDEKKSRNDSLDQDMKCYEAEIDISKSNLGKQNLGGFQNYFHKR